MRHTATLLVGLTLAGCQGAVPCFQFPYAMSPEAEALAGDRAAPAVEARYGGVVRDPQAEQRMTQIGQRLARHVSEFPSGGHYRLLDSNELNAVSLPGGRVYITRGLYARLSSDGQLAAVLAHEMAHIVSRDHFKPRCGCCEEAIAREQAADTRGARYLRQAGITPQAMIEVIVLIEDAQPRGWSDTRVRSLRLSMG